ncbi:hypothetical protein FDECE_255 [Fusarium decemcellulare]|nr:hypothetical protein FDECE_255 [Fusarium decemcellulare]
MAKASGGIMIPRTGVGNAPADLTVYFLASHIWKIFNTGTLQLMSAPEVKVQPSAGSMDAVLSEHDAYGRSQMTESLPRAFRAVAWSRQLKTG